MSGRKVRLAHFKRVGMRSIYRARIFELKAVKIRVRDGHEFTHEVIVHPGAAVVVPILPHRRFVLIRQFRTATGKVMWEFPAGTLEHGESPLACAKREIIEEIGYEAKHWKKLTAFYPAPGISTEFMHIFLASGLSPSKMSLDRDEYIEKRIVGFSKLKKMILNGTIVDSKTIIGFYFYCQKHSKAAP